jgi:Ni,Fe-hydrogenase III large subunit
MMASDAADIAPALADLGCRFVRQPGGAPIVRAQVDAAQWRGAAAAAASSGGRLVALWGIDRRGSGAGHAVAAAYALGSTLVWLDLPLADATGGAEGDAASAIAAPPAGALVYPDLSSAFACASRMQRAVADLNGLHAVAAPQAGRPEPVVDRRPWLRHAAWPADYFPLRIDADAAMRPATTDERYPFVTVEGEGVHEIAVGPVHAGIIEPGHFRFSVVGEKVLRLEERLGYTHKGIERRFAGMEPAQGARLAARVSGDTTVGYGWAYCAAVESLCGSAVPQRALWLRALALERERIANHLGDLGALGNDAGFAFGLAQFSRLREDWLRRNAMVFGHRLLMDWIVPGGVRADVDTDALRALAADAVALDIEVARLAGIYDGHAGLQDRFAGTGCVPATLARQLNLTGLAARASGAGSDLRAHPGAQPYNDLDFRPALSSGGDVAARVAVRFAEITESLRLLGAIAGRLPAGPVLAPLGAPQPRGWAAGWVEAWRGELMVALELDEHARILRGHCHDPSWQNWPVLETAVIGNIVPDFPLINKSFNLSYSGQDL